MQFVFIHIIHIELNFYVCICISLCIYIYVHVVFLGLEAHAIPPSTDSRNLFRLTPSRCLPRALQQALIPGVVALEPLELYLRNDPVVVFCSDRDHRGLLQVCQV